MPDYSIGVHLGGTNLRAAAINQTGTMLRKISGSTHLSAGPEAVVDDMVRSIRILRDEFGAGALSGVGVGSPGFIQMETGVITGAPNLPGFDNFLSINHCAGTPAIIRSGMS